MNVAVDILGGGVVAVGANDVKIGVRCLVFLRCMHRLLTRAWLTGSYIK